MLCLLRGRVTTESAEITEVEESVRESRGGLVCWTKEKHCSRRRDLAGLGRSSAAPVQDRPRLGERVVLSGLEGLAHDAVDGLGAEVA